MSQLFVRSFVKGLVTSLESSTIVRGSASDCLNWQFLGDHIELRRGQKLLGAEEIQGSGRVTGLLVGKKHNGTEVPIFTYGRKFLYYDSTSGTNNEISTNILPSGADGEDMAISQYNSLAGSFAYLSSPNSSIYKIATANPSSYTDLLSNTYRGKMTIKQSRAFLWDRKDDFGGSDKTGVYLSKIDHGELSYSFTSAEILATGDGTTTSFSGTLAFKASQSKETCFFLTIAGGITTATAITAISKASSAQITSNSHGLSVGDTVTIGGVVGMTEINNRIGVVLSIVDVNNFTVNIDSASFTVYSSGGSVCKAERFIDDRSGVLTGQLGGTGTINYTTGAYSVTFANAVTNSQKVVTQYYRELTTTNGIADFDFSTTRLAGEGAVFRQDDGGQEMQNVFSFGNIEYCMHKTKTWALTIPLDDRESTNLIYRDRVGIPYWRAGVATGDGVYYIDDLGENPKIRVLEYGRPLGNVVPRSISDQLDLKMYEFDYAVMFEWGNYICFACRTNDSTVNNRLFMYHKIWKGWEVHNFRISCLDIFGGALIGGDSGSNNIYTLFSGLADGETKIENYFITNDDDCDKDGIKKLNRVRVIGDIATDQSLDISYSTDGEPFVLAKTVEGDGPYVDLNNRKLIGNTVLGEEQIGGGADPANTIYASPYEVEFFVGTKKFERIRFKFEAKEIGYVSVSEYSFIDIRDKGKKSIVKHIV